MNLRYGIKEETYKAVRGYEYLPEVYKLLENKNIELFAVKNQTAAFQILLFCDEEVSLSITDRNCFDKKGIIDNVRLRVIIDDHTEYIKTSMNIIGFMEDDDRLHKADILLKDESVYVEKGWIQPVWVELNILNEATSGKYTGKVEIFIHKGFTSEEKIGEVTFVLEVAEVTLCQPSDYSFYLDLWQHNSNIARKHEVPLWSEEHFVVIEKYIKTLSDIGQKAVSVIVSEIPWSGQFCYRNSYYPSDLFEYSMVKVEKDQDGKFSYDFTAMDRYIQLCFKYGIEKEIEVFGLLNIWVCEEEGFGKIIHGFSDGIRVRFLDRRDDCYKYIEVVGDIALYIKAVEAHFIELGLMEKVRVVADEPSDVKVFNERLGFLKNIAPKFKYKAAIDHIEFIREANGEIEDFVPSFTAICEETHKVVELKKEIEGKICWYTSCIPDIPNTFIRSNLLESYGIGWLTEYMGLDGFLRWNYTVWPEKPRERMSYRAPFWKAGDMNFVYPANNGTPLLTLRYKALLRGIQTFELLTMLKKNNSSAQNILNRAYEKIFKFKELEEFHFKKRKNIEELISLEYKEYIQALEIIINGIVNKNP